MCGGGPDGRVSSRATEIGNHGWKAEYASGRLRVEATSTRSTATLKVYVTATGMHIGTLTNAGSGRYRGEINWSTNPQNITVKSSAGGSASATVRTN